jgi:hypothetical protein
MGDSPASYSEVSGLICALTNFIASQPTTSVVEGRRLEDEIERMR